MHPALLIGSGLMLVEERQRSNLSCRSKLRHTIDVGSCHPKVNWCITRADIPLGILSTRPHSMLFWKGQLGWYCKSRKFILGMPELTIRHSGAYIGHEIIIIPELYKIPDQKIGYFTFDNALNSCPFEASRIRFDNKETGIVS